MFQESHPRPAHVIAPLVLAILGLAVFRTAPSAWAFVGLLAWYGVFAMGGIAVWMFGWWLIDQRRESARLASEQEYCRHQLALDLARQINLMSANGLTTFVAVAEQLYEGLWDGMENNPDYNKQDYIPAHPVKQPTEQIYNIDGTEIEHSTITTWLDLAERHNGRLPAIGDPKQRGNHAYARPKLEAFTRYLCQLDLADWSRGNRAATLKAGRDDVLYALEQDRI